MSVKKGPIHIRFCPYSLTIIQIFQMISRLKEQLSSFFIRQFFLESDGMLNLSPCIHEIVLLVFKLRSSNKRHHITISLNVLPQNDDFSNTLKFELSAFLQDGPQRIINQFISILSIRTFLKRKHKFAD
jgi:hypothetical protein